MGNQFIKIREFTFTNIELCDGNNIMINLPCYCDECHEYNDYEYNDGPLYLRANCIIAFYEHKRTCDVEYNEKQSKQYIENNTHSFVEVRKWRTDIYEYVTIYNKIYTEYRICVDNGNGTHKIYCTKIKPTTITLADILSDE
jgi:hypothetical protein